MSGRRIVGRRTPLPPEWFESLWKGQSGKCALCDEPMPRTRADVAHATLWRKWRPTFDHIHPVSRGGGDRLDNLRLAHATCNRRRGATPD